MGSIEIVCCPLSLEFIPFYITGLIIRSIHSYILFVILALGLGPFYISINSCFISRGAKCNMIKRKSGLKREKETRLKFKEWVDDLASRNGRVYEEKVLQTSLGNTQVYGLNLDRKDLKPLLIFPGYRTSSLIWDLDKGMQPLLEKCRIFFIETNGQPNLSAGNSPSIRNLDYGKWGEELFDALGLTSAFIAGASFGGLVCMKIALYIPQRIKACFLLNPACFSMISLRWDNLFYNLLPILNSNRPNVETFLDKVIFSKPNHALSKEGEAHLIKYIQLAISSHRDRNQKPYYMGSALDKVRVDTYLFIGDQDILIPPQRSVQNAKKHLKGHLKEVIVFEGVGHGIELYTPCIEQIARMIEPYEVN